MQSNYIKYNIPFNYPYEFNKLIRNSMSDVVAYIYLCKSV